MHAFLLFPADRRTGHAKIFIGKISKVIFLEVAGRFTSFLDEKLRMIKAVNVDTLKRFVCAVYSMYLGHSSVEDAGILWAVAAESRWHDNTAAAQCTEMFC